ncbi:MAG TPA: acyl-CoA dehydrogenase family protein [Actinomycetota bacterium]|nr:acyl-CoA dehydrogenase family protein [Actinomycetota bacterium]
MTFLQQPPRLGDAWSSDAILRDSMRFCLGDRLPEAEPYLKEMGKVATDPATLALAARADKEPPEHIPYSPWGERVDDIRVSDAYRELGRIGVEAGVTALPYEDSPLGPLARVAWAGLLVMWGPSSALYSCPVAMTDGAARTLVESTDPGFSDVVRRLTARCFEEAWTSGQWMTETSGGSDVSGTGTIAERDPDGTWRLYGTKWFTSSTTSEVALALARPRGGPRDGPRDGMSGSKGLALFLVPRRLGDGRLNAIRVRRLKDKLGTRALPTAELELEGAAARPIGDPWGGGVKRIATMLNLTRLHNALGSTGSLARGVAWACAYARIRSAFGKRLVDLPAQRATLVDLTCDYAAALALSLRVAELVGRRECAEASADEETLLRGLTPVAKAATARWAVAGAAEAMEALGGPGYCEDSTLPALVRDTHVQPIWEGTTNVLSLDFLRACGSGAWEALSADVCRMAGGNAGDPLGETRGRVLAALEALQTAASRAVAGSAGQEWARTLALGAGRTYACARLMEQARSLAQGSPEAAARTAAIAGRIARRGLVPPPPPDHEDLRSIL